MQKNAINERTAPFLLTLSAREILAELQPDELRPDRLLSTLTRLRGVVSGEEAGALVALAQLRRRAIGKFPDGDRLYFVPEALEQATTWAIAHRRAEWLHRHLPPGPVLDLGCGIGGDTLALARFRQVYAYERDPVRLRFAAANAEVLGVADRIEFRQQDWSIELEEGQLPDVAGAFADPSRRRQGRRVFSLHAMEPPLASLLALQAQVPALGVKVMPGVDSHEIPPGCGTEFTGHDAACKEAVLWFGPLAIHGRWANVHVADAWHKIVADEEERVPVGPIHVDGFLHEPHPALIRAGAFGELCRQLDAHLIDRQIAYLASPLQRRHPLAQTFRVLEVHPFGLKRLNRRLQALDIGTLELKKRGFPVEPEQLRGRLKPVQGGRPAVLLIVRRGNGHDMIIAERV